jgi:SAM-dependent methyltransferase
MPGAPDRLSPAPAYDPIAEVYDLEHEGFADDIPLMRNIAEIVGDPIVELGCGSGRVLLPIVADGFDVTGVDTSPAMLRRLEERAREVDGGKVTLLEGDMRGPLPLPSDTFGVAIFSLNGLMHLESQADQIAALAEAARLLDPRGQLVVDLFHPTPEYLTHLAHGPHLEGVWTDDSGREVEKWSHRRVHPSTQTIDTRVWYDSVDDDGTLRRLRSSFTLRYVHPAELELMLARAGFVEWKLYGSYDLDPLDDASDRLVALAELTPS